MSPQSRSAILHRSLDDVPHHVESASGAYLNLENGRKILDACGGAAVSIVGHGDPRVMKAVVAQMEKVSYAHALQYTTQVAEELGKFLLKPHASSPHFEHGLEKVYFGGSGSEANDVALKLLRQYWFEKGEFRRNVCVARRQAYHGGTIGAMSISGMPGRKVPYEGILMPHVEFVDPADAFHHRRVDESETNYAARLVEEIRETFEQIGPERIICFSGESVSGAALGSMPAPKGYWQGVRALCDEYSIPLHLDEVMCGMGRTGTYFAFEQEEIKPDIVTIGKGLGGGYIPISAMLINGKIAKGVRSFNHGQTFQAHPVACAAALEVQKIVENGELVEQCAEKGKLLEKFLNKTFDGAKHVADIRGRGLFWSVEFMADPQTKVPFSKCTEFAAKIRLAAFDRAVAFYPGSGTVDGEVGDHLIVAPPYTVSTEQLEFMVKVLKQAYDHVVCKLLGPKL